MSRLAPARALALGLALSFAAPLACGKAGGPEPERPEVALGAGRTSVAPAGAEERGAEFGDPGPIPVGPRDPAWGSPGALVTIVEFGDFECPFCVRSAATLEALKREYGPEKLRVVWKNLPLPFHRGARQGAELAMALFEARGAPAFWRLHDGLFAGQKDLASRGPGYEAALRRAGITPAEARSLLSGRGGAASKVDEDLALAEAIGATGTPTFFVNGIVVRGAQPLETFRAVVDEELAKAEALLRAGTPPSRLYAASARANFEIPEPEGPPEAPPVDPTVYRVPVDGAPARGPKDALVTLVVFGDYQCPFCARAEQTITRLESEYRGKLRVVFRNQPLPFHPRAEPAAHFALEALAQKGEAGFWQAHDLLFSDPTRLEDADLDAHAAVLGLDAAAARRAVATRKHRARLGADMDLALDLDVSGTPQTFVNGRRLLGAQPIEAFRALVDEELAKAEARVAAGTAKDKVYEAVLGSATGPVFERAIVPAPTKDVPGKGPKGAKVVVQMFADYACRHCAAAQATMDALIKAFPGKVRVVFRQRPLRQDAEASLAAEVALEAFSQQGERGFWKMSRRLFHAGKSGPLSRASVEAEASAAGLDLARLRAALDTGKHRPAVERDLAVARSAGLSATPAFTVNGEVVVGARPLRRFERAVARALAP